MFGHLSVHPLKISGVLCGPVHPWGDMGAGVGLGDARVVT
jgi:hypothetical protein